MIKKSPKMIAAGKKAAATRKKRKAVHKAARTGRWATTMTKWHITKATVGTKWQLVEFVGPDGKESRGIVDVVAIRKDHSTPNDGLKRGDLFEIILIQVKGGTAPWPTLDDIDRLRAVARHHRAKSVVLAEWRKGKQPTFYTLKRSFDRDGGHRNAWTEVTNVDELFG